MTTEEKSQMPLFSPEDEKEAQKELKRLRKNENGFFKVNHKRTGFEDKTLWDKLNLFGTLAIPVILALATIAFGWWQVHLADLQHQQDQQSANLQHIRDQQGALNQQQAAILQTYIDNIQDLLLNHNLLKSKTTDEVAIFARARTLTALQGLDPDRKSRLVQFIYEAQLIGFPDAGKNNQHDPLIDLTEANLSDANLSNVDLPDANFTNANLRVANLSGAKLGSADLSGAKLIEAQNLTQQQLDQVYSCKGAILPTGLTCHHNQ